MDRIAVGHVLFVYFIFGCLRKITINEYYLRHVSVCTSVRLEQLGSHWTDFHEILCLKIFLKSVKKILAKLRKTTITFVVYLCVRPLGTTRLPLDGFSWNLIFENFSKICRENSRKITKNDCYLRHVSVCAFVRMEQLGSRRTDFHEILFEDFLKSVEKIQVNVKIVRE